MVFLENEGFPGVEAIVGKDEVYIRYLDYENEEPMPDRRPEPVGGEPVTGWYRLAYEDWHGDMPDVFTDPSGMLLRLLPKLARGLPPLGEDKDRWSLARAAEELDRRRSKSWSRFQEFYYPAEDLYRAVRERDSFTYPEPTGIEAVEMLAEHILRRSDRRVVLLAVQPVLSGFPGLASVAFHYPAEGVEPIELPEEFEDFDREVHEELR